MVSRSWALHGGHSVLISGCSNRLASFGSKPTSGLEQGPHQLAGGAHHQQGATRAKDNIRLR